MEEKRKSSVIKLIILTIEALLELILAGTMIGMSNFKHWSWNGNSGLLLGNGCI